MKMLSVIVTFLVTFIIAEFAYAQYIGEVYRYHGKYYVEVYPEYIGPVVPGYNVYGDYRGLRNPGIVWPGPLPGYILNPIPRTIVIDPCRSDPRCVPGP